MKTAILAVLLSAAASPARALVWQVWNKSDSAVSVETVNAGCDNKTRALGPTTGFTQMDWRGGCTGTCAYNVYVRWTDAKGVPYCKHWFTAPGSLVNACKSQKVTISGSSPWIGMAGFKGTWYSEDCL